ncbi:endolytic transglycosylase MltG [Niallia sp. Sow4_A1]|jgi:carbamoylphosphate synthase small subunit|uniref:endolytic transglycosylase MltG n=1 Tax=Bacillaceae TaxID=186817 RepID=UPI0004E1DDF7|nr:MULTISPECIES: endolytic transglycosylase MltG [Bacillaceae]MCF2646915.1 endolytic transglycosylase MltG [Niallia circulans]CAI9388681.1 Endolytic murein transglycosylase [Bacillus sp. T2.9-1]
MKKQSLRSFAIGMLLSASVIGSYYFYMEKNTHQDENFLNTNDATTYLKKQGFIVLSNVEYEELNKSIEENKQEQAKSDTEANNKQEEAEKEAQETYSYTLKVKSGMSISTIAELLYKNKIVKDQEEFETYLIDNDYHTKIQVGSFRLTSEMSHKKIAVTLTK